MANSKPGGPMELGVSYVPAHWPYHVAADMAHMKSIGCTEVLVALQENHVGTLDGAVRYGAKIAKDNGLRPYAVAWGFMNSFGGGSMSMLLFEYLGLWRRTKDRTPAPKVCLNNPRLIKHFVDIAGLFRENGYEGIFIDEPTPSRSSCDHDGAANAPRDEGFHHFANRRFMPKLHNATNRRNRVSCN